MKIWIIIITVLLAASGYAKSQQEKTMKFYNLTAKDIDGKSVKMDRFQGKVILVVNTASKCGFTGQFKDLEKLYKKYKEKGLVILGFPCNQFMNQDPGSNKEIMSFCKLNYGVTFPMFSKIKVNGDETHPIYKYLKQHSTGFMGTEFIKWNFTKFLIDRKGVVKERFSSSFIGEELEREILKYL